MLELVFIQKSASVKRFVYRSASKVTQLWFFKYKKCHVENQEVENNYPCPNIVANCLIRSVNCDPPFLAISPNLPSKFFSMSGLICDGSHPEPAPASPLCGDWRVRTAKDWQNNFMISKFRQQIFSMYHKNNEYSYADLHFNSLNYYFN